MLFLLLLLFQAQSFTGTYEIPGARVPITLTLRQASGGRITGTLVGRTRFDVRASVKGSGQFEGFASNASGRMYIAGQLDGATGNLGLVMAEVGPDGQARPETAQQAMAVRTNGRSGGRAAGKNPSPPTTEPPGRGGVRAASGADRQLAQLLTSSAWCSFNYSGAGAGSSSGTTSTERVVFRANGTGVRSTGSESYYANPNGSAYGNNTGGGAFQWRVAGGVLSVADQSGESRVPLAVSRNSNGYPIITANGKESSMCN